MKVCGLHHIRSQQVPAKGPFAKAEIALMIITGSAITFNPPRLSVPVASFFD